MKALLVLIFSFTLFLAGCSQNSPVQSNAAGSDNFSDASYVQNDHLVSQSTEAPIAVSESQLTDAEIAGLQFMREEEKVARDIYLAMAQQYNLRIFKNIAKSEQVHMNALKVLLTRFGVDDPVTNNEPGVFTNPQLQNLYNTLLARGMSSANEALLVGKDIELTDIADLENQLQNVVNNTYVQRVYNNLNRASHFHLNAFNYAIQSSSK